MNIQKWYLQVMLFAATVWLTSINITKLKIFITHITTKSNVQSTSMEIKYLKLVHKKERENLITPTHMQSVSVQLLLRTVFLNKNICSLCKYFWMWFCFRFSEKRKKTDKKYPDCFRLPFKLWSNHFSRRISVNTVVASFCREH